MEICLTGGTEEAKEMRPMTLNSGWDHRKAGRLAHLGSVVLGSGRI
jgi:hypothetical protein